MFFDEVGWGVFSLINVGVVYEVRNGVDGVYDCRIFSRCSRGFGLDMMCWVVCLKLMKSDMYFVDCCLWVLLWMKLEVCIWFGVDKIFFYFLLYSVL